jgi:BirA family transcriptional regulator, biotin operon repressor / biotin---[acetyl-CoA-carboxylase] ligase
MNFDRLILDKIKKNLRTKIIGREIITFEHTTSTMDIAKQMLNDSIKEGITIFAESQTKGRGRSGKMWFCPKSKGLLLTIILRPAIPLEKSYLLIGFLAVATVKTIRNMFKLPVEIDWPNDIVINKKKLGGIVIETHNETGKYMNYIVGIGINVNLSKQELPGHVDKPVTSLAIEKEMFIDRARLARALLQNLDSWYLILKEERYEYIVEKWQELCANVGQKMIIRENGREYSGNLLEITDSGELMLLLDSGRKKTFKIEHTIVKHNN